MYLLRVQLEEEASSVLFICIVSAKLYNFYGGKEGICKVNVFCSTCLLELMITNTTGMH